MRKRTRRQPVTGLSPVHKAEIRRAWRADIDRASLHAFIGEDPQALMRQAGGVVYEGTLRHLIVDGLAACERPQSRLNPASLYRATFEVMPTDDN